MREETLALTEEVTCLCLILRIPHEAAVKEHNFLFKYDVRRYDLTVALDDDS